MGNHLRNFYTPAMDCDSPKHTVCALLLQRPVSTLTCDLGLLFCAQGFKVLAVLVLVFYVLLGPIWLFFYLVYNNYKGRSKRPIFPQPNVHPQSDCGCVAVYTRAGDAARKQAQGSITSGAVEMASLGGNGGGDGDSKLAVERTATEDHAAARGKTRALSVLRSAASALTTRKNKDLDRELIANEEFRKKYGLLYEQCASCLQL